MEKSSGTYALILEAATGFEVTVGKRGQLHGRPGWYAYVGSAFGPGGVKARVQHHAHAARCPHWHIDHLRRVLPLKAVWYTHDPLKREHEWACLLARMAGAAVPFAGFGASDCTCAAHLIYFEGFPSFRAFRKSLSSSKVKTAAVLLS